MPDEYPDGNPKTVFGVVKPPYDAIPPSALRHLGGAMAEGKAKYGLFNWREKPVTTSVYYNAALRHLLSFWDGANSPPDGLAHELAYVMANCAVLLDALEQGTLNDDRTAFPGKKAIEAPITSTGRMGQVVLTRADVQAQPPEGVVDQAGQDATALLAGAHVSCGDTSCYPTPTSDWEPYFNSPPR